ncbi:PRC-barrel domain-containing protein [Gloeocapsa sp. PCC 73106]|uniref:PRC-barrel domain-containing protein n=1 Tax=Gloeocapsa sp. PCC 73106 TaxID=102232 RepID=UPI0002AC21EC|nr:PRC-barrel domain-containing protein [Gloeocapsa sp. PCC 73106]ELR96405.1 hypothetical protein GLO73106DRAFT_00001990 [Gloeocapsa sp. PCC 73106]
MGLLTIDKYDINYQVTIFQGHDLKSYSVYADNSHFDKDKVGLVHDVLVDEYGYICYLVIDTEFWVFGKKVLLPSGLCQFDYLNNRVYANGLTKQQVQILPKYDNNTLVDYDYEEIVKRIYRDFKDYKKS